MKSNTETIALVRQPADILAVDKLRAPVNTCDSIDGLTGAIKNEKETYLSMINCDFDFLLESRRGKVF